MSQRTFSVAFDAKRAYFNNTGLGNYSRDVISNLCTEFPHINFYGLTPFKKNKQWDFNHSNYQYITSKIPTWRSLFSYFDLKKNNIDLYHGLSNEIPIITKNIKTVVTIHDLIFLRYPELYPYIDRKIYEKKFLYSAKKADKIVSISKQTANDLIKFYQIPAKKIEVVYQTCHENFRKQYTDKNRKQVSLKYNLPVKFCLFIGRIEKRKNLISILKAYKENNIDIPLICIGRKTNDYKEIANYIEAHKLHNITFLSNVEFKDFPLIYQLSEVMIYPSLFEGFGIPIIEAQFSQTAVITSNLSSMPEAAGDGAILIDPSNPQEIAKAIINITTNKKLRQELIEKGNQNTKKFTPQRQVKSLFNIYDQLI